ncbi:unnamed protein product, partial [Laminaria digitata]
RESTNCCCRGAWPVSSVGTAGRQSRRGTLYDASAVASPRPLSSHRSLIDPLIPWDFETKSSKRKEKEYLTSHLPLLTFFFLAWRRRGGSGPAARVPHWSLALGQMSNHPAQRRRTGRRSSGDQASGRSRNKACRRDAAVVDRPRLECRWESANRRRSTNGGGATGVIGSAGEMLLRCRGRRARALLGMSIFLAMTLCQ